MGPVVRLLQAIARLTQAGAIKKVEDAYKLAKRELGERFGEYKEKVFRHYQFYFPVAHSALVLFSDGKIFHKLDLRTGFFKVEHLCKEDLYRGSFCVESSNAWLSEWKVSGPSKKLILENHCQRLK